MQRRTFIKTATHGAIGLAVGEPPALTQVLPLKIPPIASPGPHDENFWPFVRAQFPLTHERIYLNTGGLGASPYAVIHAVQNKIAELERVCETGHTEELWRATKTLAGKILGCDPEEIAYTRNTTEGVNIVCNGLPLKKGDEVITTTHEHVGNTIAWLARRQRDGIVVKVFEPSIRSVQENLDRIEKLINPKTRALSIPHITTTTGQILPVKAIGELARARKLWYFVDGAQAPGMLPVNVREIDCDAYATSGHKWLLGPKGTGLLYVRKDMLEVIAAQWVGAYSNTGNFDLRTGEFHFHPSAQRYEYGTVSVPLFTGLGAAMDFLLRVGIENIWLRNASLAAALQEGLSQLGAEMLSPQNSGERSAMITFRIKNLETSGLQTFLAQEYKLRTRGVNEAGLDGLRISLHLYNSFDEVERILESVQAAQRL